MATEGLMIVSRVKVGWFIMAGSLFLFRLAALYPITKWRTVV
jgi:hypothetical protein